MLETTPSARRVPTKTRRAHMVGALTTAIAFASLAPACAGGDGARTPAGAVASCSSDADCVVVAKTGCCSCCPSAPMAIPKAEHERQENMCAAADCAPCDASIECAKVDAVAGYRARCRDGTCAATKN